MNCLLMFELSRKIGHDYVVKMINEKFSEKNRDRILNAPNSKLFTLLFICRLIPIIPYNLINYGFGLTNISLSKYMFASILGIIPGTLVYLNLGDKVLNVGSKEFYQAIILVVGLTVVSLIFAKIIDKKDKEKQKNLK
ncbi:MAG: VTT domain-containing protein, partial [Finegoldia magna]|nr:VTT domain-containing protein [Finegoldia magna]